MEYKDGKTPPAALRVGLKYCGGCNLRYDRLGTLQAIKNQCSSQTIFTPVQEGESYDFILVINGCQAQCADRSRLKSRNGLFSLFQWADPNRAVAEIKRLERDCTENK